NELLVLCNEVGLASELDQRDLAVSFARSYEALARRAVSALCVTLGTLEAQDLRRLFQVTVGLFEGLLGVDHSGTELFAQCLDVRDRNVGHVCGSFCSLRRKVTWTLRLLLQQPQRPAK